MKYSVIGIPNSVEIAMTRSRSFISSRMHAISDAEWWNRENG